MSRAYSSLNEVAAFAGNIAFSDICPKAIWNAERNAYELFLWERQQIQEVK